MLFRSLFTQPGANMPAVTESEVLTASEGMRGMMDYYAHAVNTTAVLGRLAGFQPSLLACQHGSAYRGDGAALLAELSATIARANAGEPPRSSPTPLPQT